MNTDLMGTELDAAKADAEQRASETGTDYCLLNFGSMREKPRFAVVPLEEARRDAKDTLSEYLVYTTGGDGGTER